MSARRLTDAELNSIENKMQKLHQKVEDNKISIEEALEQAYAEKDLLKVTLDPNDISKLRQNTWQTVQDCISNFQNKRFEIERQAGPKFKATDALDISATKRVNDVKILIKKITLNGKMTLNKEEQFFSKDRKETVVSEEKYARIRLAMLNNYGKYIEKGHPKLDELWQMYNDKTISNYMEYARSMYRNEKRDSQIAEKIRQNLDNYSDKVLAQSVLNLLEPSIPEVEEKKASTKRKSRK